MPSSPGSTPGPSVGGGSLVLVVSAAVVSATVVPAVGSPVVGPVVSSTPVSVAAVAAVPSVPSVPSESSVALLGLDALDALLAFEPLLGSVVVAAVGLVAESSGSLSSEQARLRQAARAMHGGMRSRRVTGRGT
ncbi:hypothetical protein OV079_07030 [Nannocystis pusilla]|uniref:Uncharacterized protein n=1 Tax=Nannocystis pusilla TaxID=889268 RepID=A0A9X3EJM7_9BACT|nr:hypothetical protein [Nannocystis pusilla]MCY1005329.1 hypothetical protein [Nannocystis pusilla]